MTSVLNASLANFAAMRVLILISFRQRGHRRGYLAIAVMYDGDAQSHPSNLMLN